MDTSITLAKTLETQKEVAVLLPKKEPSLCPGPDGKIIPVCEPRLSGREGEYLAECLKTNWISSGGPFVPAFEEAFSVQCGCRYGIACTSGTTALHLAMATLGLGRGDEVILPTFTMIATANAVAYTGAKPVLVDSEPKTWNIDIEQIEMKITSRTKAIVPIHTYGHPADMDPLVSLSQRKNLVVIEDAAHAHGAEYKGKRAGGFGQAACFSFYANKIITTGEGGMITTNDEAFAEKARMLRDHAFSKERHFWHKVAGFNYRMTNLQAAIGLAQTEQFDSLVEARIKNAEIYEALLKETPGLTLPPRTPGIKNVFWMYAILVEKEFGISRDALRQRLASKGIETRTFFIPIHLQPIYRRKYRREFPVSEELCEKGMYLPSAPTLTKKDIERIALEIRRARTRKG
ncbi:MAG: DegT/DnrJ/EryC1/StrS family aminotransferase [Candidatus Omnitrophica bacterium]|nr:DegT/DnrJ/EryC1/StrS family aminotransferase [Candidatus Omnitrophota bacterium]